RFRHGNLLALPPGEHRRHAEGLVQEALTTATGAMMASRASGWLGQPETYGVDVHRQRRRRRPRSTARPEARIHRRPQARRRAPCHLGGATSTVVRRRSAMRMNRALLLAAVF